MTTATRRSRFAATRDLISQTYLDYATPALAAGALRDKRGHWHMSDSPDVTYVSVGALCVANGIEPIRMDPPKTRALRARKLRAETTPGDRDWQAMRALQYAVAMRGEETKFQEFRHRAERDVQFDKAPDGSRRVRKVKVDCAGWQEIPHWDFVPECVELTDAQGVFA